MTDFPAAQRFGFLLVPNFSLIALSSAVDPLRLANMALGRRVFDYVTIGVSTEPVLSSDGIRVLPDQVMGESSRFDTVFVIGPNPIPRRGFGEVTQWLRRLAAKGITLGGIDTGCYFLAKAGLLDGYRCTIHWEDRETLLEEFPALLLSSRLFEIDRDRYTCSGGVSPLDLMTFVLRRPPGNRELAQKVSDLLVAYQRSPDDNQSLPMRYRYANIPEVLLEALEMMESNVEEPLSPAEIAAYLKVSRRQLERQFRDFLKTSPARKYLEMMESNVEEPLSPAEIAAYLKVSRRQLERQFRDFLKTSPARKYLEIRLARARLSVLRTNRRIDDIAASCGFASTAHFIARYRLVYAQSPQAERMASPSVDN